MTMTVATRQTAAEATGPAPAGPAMPGSAPRAEASPAAAAPSGTRAHRGAVHRVWGVVSSAPVALVIVVAALAIAAAASSHTTADGVHSIFGHPVMTVQSGSMTPVIDTGDLIIDRAVTPAEADHLQVGQIISFRVGAKVFTHRIIAVVPGAGGTAAYRTKGIANDAPDAALRPASSVIGVYEARVDGGAYLLRDLRNPELLILLVAGIILAVSAGPLIRWIRRFDDDQHQVPS